MLRAATEEETIQARERIAELGDDRDGLSPFDNHETESLWGLMADPAMWVAFEDEGGFLWVEREATPKTKEEEE